MTSGRIGALVSAQRLEAEVVRQQQGAIEPLVAELRRFAAYVRRQLRDAVALTFTLLDQGLLTSVLADPTRIRREVEARALRDTVVCIDEIQK